MTSCMAMTRSCIVSSVACLTKKDPDFVNKKRANENKKINCNVLNHMFSFFLHKHEDEEIKHCKCLLKKNDHFSRTSIRKIRTKL